MNLVIWKFGDLEIVKTGKPEIGLCATCTHANVIVSDRGSRFYSCLRSKTDPRFPRYPLLPVVACIGYDERACTSFSRRD